MWAPFGAGADRRVTVRGCRRVLVLVPHVVAGTRLMDLLPLLEADHRVQVVCAVPGDAPPGTAEFVRAHGVLLIPWRDAVRHEFDLVLAASHRDVDQVHGPVMVVPHGASALKSRRRNGHGLDRESLLRRGRVVAKAIVLTHSDELTALTDACPEAAPRAVVAGDICLDRMRASLPHRENYRRALGVDAGETLVTISSTWAAESTFGSRPDLYRALLTGHRVAAVLHPNIWQVHGEWQVRAWLADCPGLLVVPPWEGWRAAVVASDVVVGDHGSVTQYAAAAGVPVVLASTPEVRRHSLADVLAFEVPLLDADEPLVPQARRVPELAGLLSSRLDGAAAVLRQTMYQLLRLPEPARACRAEPVPAHRV